MANTTVKMLADEDRRQTTSLRFFNFFRARQDPKGQDDDAGPIFFDHAMNNEPITIYRDGQQIRDFIYVKDVVIGLARILPQRSGKPH